MAKEEIIPKFLKNLIIRGELPGGSATAAVAPRCDDDVSPSRENLNIPEQVKRRNPQRPRPPQRGAGLAQGGIISSQDLS